MAGKTLDLDNLITKDQLACRISDYWLKWNTFRDTWLKEKEEIRKYVFATDTSTTTNSKNPWNNRTTIPKLCQIRDNLFANYMATMFPRRRFLVWEGATEDDESKDKAVAIRDYMTWVIEQPWFKDEIAKLALDYIDYGNCIVTVDWKDDRIELDTKIQVGYVGPVPRRISPLDVVVNPVATSFADSPKIVRSLISIGEAKEMLERLTTSEEDKILAQEILTYMKELRHTAQNYAGNIRSKDEFFSVDGFQSYQAYLQSDYVEVLTYYGDIYDKEKDEYLRNHLIMVVDRHKVFFKAPHPSFFGKAPIYHSGWRVRQDNLWAMGPLDNLVGMQYRIDHVENMKADIFDLTRFPVLKIKGYVEDFQWAPLEKIYVGDEGDVEMLAPDVQVLQANIEISTYQQQMEEMAGAPKEAMGFRTPGEKTMYEVQRLENAASRVFQNKIAQFEEQILEPLLNAMLELARRNMQETVVRVLDDEFKMANFSKLTAQDITGQGRIRPIAARHFAERAQLIQNLTNWYGSVIGQDPDIKAHYSSIGLAKMSEELLEIEDYKIVEPYIRLTEQSEAQRLGNAQQEDTMVQAMTPAGIAQGDTG